jgi:hypothetical protein
VTLKDERDDNVEFVKIKRSDLERIMKLLSRIKDL